MMEKSRVGTISDPFSVTIGVFRLTPSLDQNLIRNFIINVSLVLTEILSQMGLLASVRKKKSLTLSFIQMS